LLGTPHTRTGNQKEDVNMMLAPLSQSVAPLEFKTDEMIRWAIDEYGDKTAVSCSWGKDSLLVLYKALKIDPNIRVMNAIAMPFKETIQFSNRMITEWDLNCEKLRPYKGMNYWKCVEKYGLPHIRSQKLKSPKCCYYLKEKPIKEYIKRNDIKAVLTGLTSQESWNRTQLAHRYDNIDKMPDFMKTGNERDGVHYCSMRYWAKSWNSWQIHPIMGWTVDDVWGYTHKEKIPINPAYFILDGLYDRVGCVACTAYRDWEHKLSRHLPGLYHKLKDIEFKETGQSRLTIYKQTKRTEQ